MRENIKGLKIRLFAPFEKENLWNSVTWRITLIVFLFLANGPRVLRVTRRGIPVDDETPCSPPPLPSIDEYLIKPCQRCREQPRHHLPRLCATVSTRDEAAICEMPRIKGEWPAFARFNVRWNGTRLARFSRKRIERFRREFRDELCVYLSLLDWINERPVFMSLVLWNLCDGMVIMIN